ncbi:MAG: penicillin-binding protein 2 [Anaerolineales bacterium]
MRQYLADHIVPAGRLRSKQPLHDIAENPYSTGEKAGQKLTGWRFNLLAVLFFLAGAMIIIQVIRLQFSPERNEFAVQGEQYSRTLHIFYPPRGDIYDRWGRLLAGSTLVYEVGVQIGNVENPDSIAFALSKVLVDHPEYDYAGYSDDIYAVIHQAQISGMAYVQLADFVTPDELSTLQEWALNYANLPNVDYGEAGRPSLDGLVYRPRLQRYYPENELGSNVLGFVNREGTGMFGVEAEFNDLLAGVPQSVWMTLDPYQVTEIPQLKAGADVVLTIDREIQAAAEDVLDKALKDSGADGGVILVMDPNTGEMLAIATTPRLNLNEYWNYASVYTDNTPFNRAISQDYEPGSVFKILTMAAALDYGAVKPGTEFIDTGSIQIGGITIHNWDWGAWGPQNMLGCMAHSLNVCLTWVATQLGAGPFYQYMQSFGLGRPTGIDLASEAAGRLKIPGDTDWYEADLGTNSFGQGVAVTPIQMVMAISSVANGRGEMMAPHVMRSMVRDGFQYTPSPQVVGKPISADTAHTLTEMLATTLESESSDALVDGYRVAGKTGTAEIATPTGYTSNETNASFAGWGPVDNPRFLVYVWLEKPTSSPWGSVVAAPVFRDMVERLVVLMDIPPDGVLQGLANH